MKKEYILLGLIGLELVASITSLSIMSLDSEVSFDTDGFTDRIVELDNEEIPMPAKAYLYSRSSDTLGAYNY